MVRRSRLSGSFSAKNPYLTQILASVKRNWMAVIPESAKLGRRGRVVIQFMIARDGSVPRLVIASASGTEALDRAAVVLGDRQDVVVADHREVGKAQDAADVRGAEHASEGRLDSLLGLVGESGSGRVSRDRDV